VPSAAETVRLTLVASIISCVGQDAYLEHGNGLHFFIGVGKAPVAEVEIARLFNEALQFHRTAPIAVLFAEASQGGFDRFSVLASRFFLRFSPSSGSVFWEVGKKRIMVFFRMHAAGGWFGREHLHIGGIHLDARALYTLSVGILAL
jgi:hypothetical protein